MNTTRQIEAVAKRIAVEAAKGPIVVVVNDGGDATILSATCKSAHWHIEQCPDLVVGTYAGHVTVAMVIEDMLVTLRGVYHAKHAAR